MEEKPFWVALQQAPGLGARRVLQLVKFFGSPRAAWQAPEKELLALEGLGKAATSLINWRRQVTPEKIMAKLEKTGIGVLILEEDTYPLELKRIYDPPPVLYWRGSQLPGEGLKIAIVGTRRATVYGLKVATELAAGLAAAGAGVVSGLARGIDAAAHRGAIQGKGLTWGILGCGVDVIYPPEHRQLYHQVMDHGAILSEFPPGTPPDAGHFPARNRIISGLASGTVVVEAAARSGALITADLALEQNRDVFAVPGPVTSRYSEGTNELIKQGARVVTGVADILAEYEPQSLWPLSRQESQVEVALTAAEEKVMAALSVMPTHLDTIMATTGLPPGELNTALLQLEIRKLIRRLPGGFYLRC
ncbi:DNA recombination-mediator protein A [Neomoorella glycerini]|uniref:DNA recombination-mediator protein A n=1 Tax=Neomoorella glycerini TaxID=55779 RepID=A0A6I5ZTY5_9FIRM|nr:DNA-processing protein DprA [Moorella glycerini]QGP93216.1 DNA recombination-mediator protein A [Moorella glycerini]